MTNDGAMLADMLASERAAVDDAIAKDIDERLARIDEIRARLGLANKAAPEPDPVTANPSPFPRRKRGSRMSRR